MTLHHGYGYFLLGAVWAGLAAGRALLTSNPDLQSVITDLQTALSKYSQVLKETSYLRDVPALPCNESAAHLEQSSMLVRRLSEYSLCVQTLGCPSDVISLNTDLLQHLGSSLQVSGCLLSPPPSFEAIRKASQCLHCWRQQVEALST